MTPPHSVYNGEKAQNQMLGGTFRRLNGLYMLLFL